MSNLETRQRVANADRRRTARFVVEVPAFIQTVIGERPCRIANISDSGAMIETDDPPPAGIAARLVLGDGDIFCTVVWSNETGCGVEFEDSIGDHTLKQIATEEIKEAGPIANVGRIQAGRRRSGLVIRD